MSTLGEVDPLDDEEGLDDDERALSFLRAGKQEAWLAFRLTTALRVAQLHSLDNVAVGESNQALAEALDGYLLRHGRVSLLLARECVYLNGRLVRSGHSGHAWLLDFMNLLTKRGIGGVLFAGAWGVEAVRSLVASFQAGGTSSEERCQATVQGCLAIAEPSRVQVLDPAQAREYVREEEEAHLSATELAAFYFSRLTALAEVAYGAVGAGLSPDVYGRNVRQTLRKLLEFLAHPEFERRILALTLHPPIPDWPLATHASSVCLASLCMGRLLGLSRGELSDLGFAALFHDVGRALRGRRAAPGGKEEDQQVAEAHVLDGVAFSLRGHNYGNSELLRLIVAQEHHRQSDGYPDASFLRKPHPYTRLVAAADAFHKLQSGTSWSGPVGQAQAITNLRGDAKRYDPAAVELLVDVYGRCPRGTILRMKDGSTAVSLEGAPRRGHLPIVRRITLPDRSIDTSDHVYALEAFSEIRAEVDPSGTSLDEWSALCGVGIPFEPASESVDLEALTSGGDEVEDESKPAQDQRDVKAIVELLEKAIRFFRLYPRDHPFCVQGLDELLTAFSKHLEWRGSLTIGISRAGVTLAEQLIVPEAGNATNLSYLLYPDGIRTLRFERGLDRQQVHDFVVTLARSDDDTVTMDLMDALWQREFTHIEHVAYDQLSPGVVDRLHDPMLNPVVSRLKAFLPPCRQLLLRLTAELRPHAAAVAGDGDPSAGADPAQVQAHLQTSAGQGRKALVDQLRDPFLGDTLGRAADIVAWAASDEDDPPRPADVSRFLAGTVSNVLWRGDLGRAADLLSAGATVGSLDQVSLRLTRKHTLNLLVRVLQDQGQADQGLRYLSFLTDRAIPGICKVYGTLVGNDQPRQVLRTFLASRLEAVAPSLVPLTLHSDPHIVEEAIGLLAGASPDSKAGVLLAEMVQDREHRVRAGLAAQALDLVTGTGERRECLDAALHGASREDRLQAIARLREIGDKDTFEALRALVQGREFFQRDEDEIEHVLSCLSALGGLRAVSVLQELSKRRGLLSKKSTIRVNRAALAALKAMRESSGPRAGLPCPRCRFANDPKASKCLSCGSPLLDMAATTRQVQRPAVIPALADEVPKTQRLTAAGRAQLEMQRTEEPLPAPRSREAPTQADVAQAVLWLRCHPFDPIPVGHKPVVNIGRHSTCDLVLEHGSVSRVHAVVRLVGGDALIEDRSSYGTYVNGDRVTTKQLSAGDTLTIGPYDIEVLSHDTTTASEEEGTRPLRTFASSEAIGGRLEKVSLAEVLQQIEFNEKTGTLEVFADGLEGLFVVYEGKPMYASLGDRADAEAVVAMLRLTKGTFSFASKVEAGEMTMAGMSITGLLMDASRRLDEETSRWSAGG